MKSRRPGQLHRLTPRLNPNEGSNPHLRAGGSGDLWLRGFFSGAMVLVALVSLAAHIWKGHSIPAKLSSV
jgi:hypothetical protein